MKRFLPLLVLSVLLVAVVAYASTYTNITTATTTTISARPVMLSHVMVNGGVLNTSGTIVLWDNNSTTGRKIATIDNAYAGASYVYMAQTVYGLKVVTDNAVNITVVWQ